MRTTHSLNVGLIGLGRLGRVYARDLARAILETRLVAVADPDVKAVVVVSPTNTHCSLVVAAIEQGKPTFCEKPPALSLEEARLMRDAAAGVCGSRTAGWGSSISAETASTVRTSRPNCSGRRARCESAISARRL